MYERRSRLPSYQQGELLKMFVVGATARAAAEVVGVHRNTAAGFFMRLRKLIASKLPSYARYFYLDRLMPMVIGIDKKLAIQPSLSRDTLGC